MKNKKNILILGCCLFILIACAWYFLINQNRENIELLKKYNWKVSSGGIFSKNIPIKGSELESVRFRKEMSDASENIGIDLQKYIQDTATFTIYTYDLEKKVRQRPLDARIWVSKGKIVCAYIEHFENNFETKFWSLNTPYKQIAAEIEDYYEGIENDSSNYEFLNKYGWDSDFIPAIQKGVHVKNSLLGNQEYSEGLLKASSEIGLDLKNRINDDTAFDVYDYELEKKKVNGKLLVARIWIDEGKIAAAYLTLKENGIPIKFWPMNAPVQQIANDIDKLNIK